MDREEKRARVGAQRQPRGGEEETNRKEDGSATGWVGGKPEDQSNLTGL